MSERFYFIVSSISDILYILYYIRGTFGTGGRLVGGGGFDPGITFGDISRQVGRWCEREVRQPCGGMVKWKKAEGRRKYSATSSILHVGGSTDACHR